MRALSLIPLLCLAFGTPTAAQDPSTAPPPPASEAPSAEICQGMLPASVSFQQVATTPSECVSVEGLWRRDELYDGIEGYYRAELHAPPVQPANQIGLYGWREAGAPDAPTPARLTGRSGICEDLYGPDVFFVTGYCHYTGGPYMDLSKAARLGDTPERLTGKAVRTRLGLLIDPPADWALRAYIEGKARRWLSLAAGDDPQAYATALELSDRDADLDDPESPLHTAFREPGSVFGRLRAQHDPVMRVWIIPPAPLEPDMPAPDPDDIEALACFRLGDWREDRWPVAPADADNDPARPFACVRVVRVIWPEEVLEYYVVSGGGHGLREPTTF